MAGLKKLAGQTALYGLSSIVGRALNYLLVPFYTHVFHPEQFGVVTEMYAYVAFFNILYTYGMETAFFRQASKNINELDDIFNLTQSAIVTSSIVFSVILMILAPYISVWLEYPGYTSYIYILAGILGIDAVVAIPFARLRLEGKAFIFASTKLINIFLNIFLTIWFLYFLPANKPGFEPEVIYVFWANFIANATLIVLLWPSLINFKFTLDSKKLYPYLVYAFPLMIMGMAGMVNEVIDRILLKKILMTTDKMVQIGIYGACYKLSIFMTLAIQAFRYAAEPFFFSKANDANAKKVYSKVMKWFVIICLLVYLSVCVNLDILKYLLRRPEYREGLSIVPVLLMANLALGVFYNLSIWFKLTDKTYYGVYLAIGGAIVTIVLNMSLIPIYGFYASAWTTLICYSLMVFASYLLGSRYYPIQYPLLKISIYVTFAILLSYLGMKITLENSYLNFGFHSIIIFVYVGLVYFFEQDDISKFKKGTL